MLLLIFLAAIEKLFISAYYVDFSSPIDIHNILIPGGVGVDGKYADIPLSDENVTHVLGGGRTRGGKSQFEKAAILYLACRYPPSVVQLALSDVKRVTFSKFSLLPHLIAPVAKDAASSAKLFRLLMEHMEARYREFEKVGVETIREFNHKFYPKIIDKALREYIDIHLPYIRAYQSKNFDLYNLRSCKGCQHFYGRDKIVCGMYPYGWDGIDCPDKVWDKRRIIRQFEDDAAIASLSKGLDDWKILKYDDFISLFHPHTYRQFSFDFDGQLLPYSKQLDGLEDANLVEYVNFFKRTRQKQYDYSCTDFIKQAEVFLEEVDATIRVENNRIMIRDNLNKVHIFAHNGSPIWVNNPACPQELKNDYNLPSLIDFLYNGADAPNS